MKGEIAKYVSSCDTCQRIKASHLKTAGQMQPLSIPAWKWDDISMDFIIGQMQPLSIPAWKWDDISMDFIIGLPLTPGSMITFG
jgi:hypothetical protein